MTSPGLSQGDASSGSRDRLDSWKEIAAFLGRSVQTAQRWEKREGLPVRRHPHQRQDSVYAFRSELDRWRRERDAGAAVAEAVVPAESRRRMLAAAVVLVTLGALSVPWLVRAVRARRAREWAVPRIEELVHSDGSSAALFLAYRLAADAERYIPQDARLRKLWPAVARRIDVVTEPAGAGVTITSYGGTDTIELGVSPLRHPRAPRGVLRWRARKAGYESAEGLLDASSDSLRIVLDRAGGAPAGMVRATGGTFELGLTHLGRHPPFELRDYWIDRLEVSNRQFRTFVGAGGYSDPRYWREPFEEDGRRLSFADAMHRFRDRTGRPGPATWVAGDFPTGTGDHPVTGVSWYEAMAYAAFTGKSLPTIFHWVRAAGVPANAEIVPSSNFSGRDVAATGRFPGVGAVGAYDMAGNAKEWCLNATTSGRFILGGAWNEPVYMFAEADGRSPFSREETFGFRLARYITPPAPALLAAVDFPRRDFSRERPVSDSVFQLIRGLYSYDRTPLHAVVDSVDDSSERWRRERVSFDAAYGGERVAAWVFLPRRTAPPYQTVIYFPGSSGIQSRSSRALEPPLEGAAVRSGRALVFPIYKSTFERGDALDTDYPAETDFYRAHVLDWYRDLARTLDYVETRRDLDASRIAYYGFSWGARLGPIFLALDPRLKAAVLLSGGLKFARTFPEADPFNFASRVTVPVLMVNGRYDYFFPLETSQQPLLHLLGTPPRDKRHVVLASGHSPPLTPVTREMLAWLDRYLGPVSQPRAVP